MLFSMSFEPYQGRYSRAYNEAYTLVEKGYHVTVLGWDRTGRGKSFEVRNGIRIERIRVPAPDSSGIRSLPNFLWFSTKLFFHLKGRRFDLIHCHNLQLLPLGILLKRQMKVPLIFDSCEPDYFALYPPLLRNLVKSLEKLMAGRADAIFVHNNYQVRKYRAMGHPGVTLIGSYPTKEMVSERIQRPLKKDKIIIGRIGSVYQDNGIEEILSGFRMISKSMDNVDLFFAGRVFDSFQKTFSQLIKGLENRVTVLGAFNAADMQELYNKIDISIMVYRRTPWFRNITPTKFFDSLAMGVPVIVSDMGGLKDIIERYACGMVVDERRPEDVAEAIKRLVERPDLRYNMAVNGLKAINENYSWELMKERLLEIYGTLMS